LKPIRRKTRKPGGKTYTHYVISTTVPERWRDGVQVIITPLIKEEGFAPSPRELGKAEKYLTWLRELYPEGYRDLMDKLDEVEEALERYRREQEEAEREFKAFIEEARIKCPWCGREILLKHALMMAGVRLK